MAVSISDVFPFINKNIWSSASPCAERSDAWRASLLKGPLQYRSLGLDTTHYGKVIWIVASNSKPFVSQLELSFFPSHSPSSSHAPSSIQLEIPEQPFVLGRRMVLCSKFRSHGLFHLPTSIKDIKKHFQWKPEFSLNLCTKNKPRP